MSRYLEWCTSLSFVYFPETIIGSSFARVTPLWLPLIFFTDFLSPLDHNFYVVTCLAFIDLLRACVRALRCVCLSVTLCYSYIILLYTTLLPVRTVSLTLHCVALHCFVLYCFTIIYCTACRFFRILATIRPIIKSESESKITEISTRISRQFSCGISTSIFILPVNIILSDKWDFDEVFTCIAQH